jgi:predicted RND superfamily exporter protein
MNLIIKISILFLSLSVFLSCNKNKKTSFLDDEKKIMQLHNLQRDYHFNKDSLAFVTQFSNDFISVNKGEITTPKREETIKRYNKYFSSVEFVKWDDKTPPIIRFSNNGSMAYTIVDKIVTLTYKDENGNDKEDTTHFAWTTIYKKYGDEWKIDCVTSTNK